MPTSSGDLNDILINRQTFTEVTKNKFYGNPSCGNLTGTVHADRQTDTTKTMRNSCDYALVPENLQWKEEEEEEEEEEEIHKSYIDSECGCGFERKKYMRRIETQSVEVDLRGRYTWDV